MLTTDSNSYPTWTSVATVDMPVGVSLEWKIVIGSTSFNSVRWENGNNRSFLVAPTALADDNTATLRGSFR